MQSLYKIIREMEVKLHSLLAEVQELKNKARQFEEENERLRGELAAAFRGNGGELSNASVEGEPGEGFLNLLGLYDQGFHICNLHFGRFRDKECLFCMAFLRRERELAAGREEPTARITQV